MESEKKKKGKIMKRAHRRKSESGGAGVRALRHLGRMERDKEEMNRLWEGELLLSFRWQSERASNRIIGQI